MAGNTIGGKKAAAKNLASNPNFYAEIGRKGGLLVYLYLCYNISTVCELRERNSEVKRSYVFLK